MKRVEYIELTRSKYVNCKQKMEMQKVIDLSICTGSFMGVFRRWNYLNRIHSKTKCKQKYVVAYAYLPVNYEA